MNEFVYITKAAAFFPNNPVPNKDMEQYLGVINEKSSLAKRVILGKNGIKRRYYALDKAGNTTHTNVQITVNAVKGLLDEEVTLEDIDVIACGTSSQEQLIPSHGVMVHGELGSKRNTEVVSFAGTCCSGMHALKYIYMSILTGNAQNAVCTGSERMSAWMTARNFRKEAENLALLEEKPMLAFEKEFLRWMLSDGAAALLLQDKPAGNGISLRIDWIELASFANEIETCMYAGSEKREDGTLDGFSSFSEEEWLTKSIFSLKQDTRLLAGYIVPFGGQLLKRLAAKRNFTSGDIDWFLPHISSMFFKEQIKLEFEKIDFAIPDRKWFLNLPNVGNIGSASAFVMLEELMRSGKLKKGEKILIMVPESARFSYCYCMLTVC